MQINSITNKYYLNLNNQKNSKSKISISQNSESLKNFAYTDLLFKAGRPATIVKPEFKTPLQEMIGNKIASFIRKLPENSKLNKPHVVIFNDKTIELLIDKTNPSGIIDVSIKLLNEKQEASNLKLSLNKHGQLRYGVYSKHDDSDIYFSSTKHNRHMEYGNANYRQTSDNDFIWSRIAAKPNQTFSPNAKQILDFSRTELLEFFSEMAKKQRSFLAI